MQTPNVAILRLNTEEEWIKLVVSGVVELEERESIFLDRVFENDMNEKINVCDRAYSELRMRDALIAG